MKKERKERNTNLFLVNTTNNQSQHVHGVEKHWRKKLMWKYIAEKGHKLKKGKRQIVPTSICDTKRCKFYGKEAAQGVCYSRIDDGYANYFKLLMQTAERHLAFQRKHNWKKLTDKQKIKHMESEVVCHFMNYSSCLNELIYLRGENAKLLLAAGKWKRK